LTILVTGGAGFIGSHTCVELLSVGHEVIVADNFSNSSPAALDAVRRLAGRPLIACEVDLRDRRGLDRVFQEHSIQTVIHFAAKKAVRESVQIPFEYFDVNITGTINLLRSMIDHDIGKLVFSSSCSIYGQRYDRPITEDDVPSPTNPYARSKLVCEQIVAETCARYSGFSVIALRYFNPLGAHPSGLIGELPLGMPYMMQVAAGKLQKLEIFGGDYDTPDGSPVRDYVHVMDVSEAHRLALDHLDDQVGMRVLNLGVGIGVSVLELVQIFEETCGVRVPYEIVGRRGGDVPTLIADASRVDKEWGWRPTRDIHDMCRDAWRFQELNPDGYGDQRFTDSVQEAIG
jgi:UDP-glucose 4-epimerase